MRIIEINAQCIVIVAGCNCGADIVTHPVHRSEYCADCLHGSEWVYDSFPGEEGPDVQ